MFLLVVYDTERRNCIKLHKALKCYLNWNQNSVFEGTVTAAQYEKIVAILESRRVAESHITLYRVDSQSIVKRVEIGESTGNTSNIL